MNQTKICTKCNIENELIEFNKAKRGKFGVRSNCKSCQSIIKHKWDTENKDKILEWRIKNPEKVKAAKIKWWLNNPDYNLKNKKRQDNYNSNYYTINKDKIKEASDVYKKTPQGKAAAKANKQNRRAQKSNNGGKHTAQDILNLFELQSGVCVYCECKLHKNKSNSFHVDHIVPLSKGGSNGIENLQLLCPTCNLSKGGKLPEEFAQQFNKLF